MPEHLQLPLNRKGVISAEIFKVEGQLRVGFFIVNERSCKLHHKCRIVDCGVFLILIFRNSEDVTAFLCGRFLNILVFHDS